MEGYHRLQIEGKVKNFVIGFLKDDWFFLTGHHGVRWLSGILTFLVLILNIVSESNFYYSPRGEQVLGKSFHLQNVH